MSGPFLSPPEGFENILVAANQVNGATGWPLYIGTFPSSVDQAVLIIEGGGRQPEVAIAIDYPALQILVRGKKNSYAAARLKAQEIFEVLQALPTGPTPLAEYPELTSVVARTAVTWVGFDEDRPVFSLNFNLIVCYETQGNRE